MEGKEEKGRKEGGERYGGRTRDNEIMRRNRTERDVSDWRQVFVLYWELLKDRISKKKEEKGKKSESNFKTVPIFCF